jgi:hypothetical protein
MPPSVGGICSLRCSNLPLLPSGSAWDADYLSAFLSHLPFRGEVACRDSNPVHWFGSGSETQPLARREFLRLLIHFAASFRSSSCLSRSSWKTWS